ncbi:hypothetical protein GGU11DRAFT_826176 [Lentinula aff. detonsa]|nr:hypothetical protein GGU11DRAFT_826176 [Lentinula aff. detonsa]
MSTEPKAKAVHFDVDTALSATTHSRPLRTKSRIPTFSSPRAYAIVMPFDEMLARAKKENPDVQKLIDERGLWQEIAAVNIMIAELCDQACEIWPNAFMVLVDQRSFRAPLQCIGLADNTHRINRTKKKNVGSEYYDVSDPFIDDSELAVDERKFFAQTKQQGFYVSSGKVALMKDRSLKKPKSKKHNTESGPSSQTPRIPHEGTKESPIALDDDDDVPDAYFPRASENGISKDRKKNLHAAGGGIVKTNDFSFGFGSHD